jgi:hypothetical protein
MKRITIWADKHKDAGKSCYDFKLLLRRQDTFKVSDALSKDFTFQGMTFEEEKEYFKKGAERAKRYKPVGNRR